MKVLVCLIEDIMKYFMQIRIVALFMFVTCEINLLYFTNNVEIIFIHYPLLLQTCING